MPRATTPGGSSTVRLTMSGCIKAGVTWRADSDRFGDSTVPSSVSVGRWFGTPRHEPFFRAGISSYGI
jgi:hypothetical protein